MVYDRPEVIDIPSGLAGSRTDRGPDPLGYNDVNGVYLLEKFYGF